MYISQPLDVPSLTSLVVFCTKIDQLEGGMTYKRLALTVGALPTLLVQTAPLYVKMLQPLPRSAWYLAFSRRRCLATIAPGRRLPQTLIEKVVQKYALDLPSGKTVKAGDYVMIRPEHCMTHDNTAAVMNK